eukprot:SAG22_NODE_1138_length_5389_cov_22.995085_9_plen_53_part_00
MDVMSRRVKTTQLRTTIQDILELLQVRESSAPASQPASQPASEKNSIFRVSQ